MGHNLKKDASNETLKWLRDISAQVLAAEDWIDFPLMWLYIIHTHGSNVCTLLKLDSVLNRKPTSDLSAKASAAVCCELLKGGEGRPLNYFYETIAIFNGY